MVCDVVPETPDAPKGRRRSCRRSTMFSTKASIAMSKQIAATPDSQDDRHSLKRTLIEESPFSQLNTASPMHSLSRRAAQIGIRTSDSPVKKEAGRNFHPVFNKKIVPIVNGMYEIMSHSIVLKFFRQNVKLDSTTHKQSFEGFC